MTGAGRARGLVDCLDCSTRIGLIISLHVFSTSPLTLPNGTA